MGSSGGSRPSNDPSTSDLILVVDLLDGAKGILKQEENQAPAQAENLDFEANSTRDDNEDDNLKPKIQPEMETMNDEAQNLPDTKLNFDMFKLPIDLDFLQEPTVDSEEP